jgi:ADP-ribose pyrophosphatase YjhB (NUDIX family)
MDWLKKIRRIQALAQTGLHYATDTFDLGRYEELRQISIQLAADLANAEPEKVKGQFASGKGFETPKVDIRFVVIKDGRILIVHEKMDNRWSLPGGFADVNLSAATVAEKEVWEEAGLEVKAKKLLALLDANQHDFPPLENHFYKAIFLCEISSGELSSGVETYDARFFPWDDLPPLSEKRNSATLMKMIREWSENVFGETYFD